MQSIHGMNQGAYERGLVPCQCNGRYFHLKSTGYNRHHTPMAKAFRNLTCTLVLLLVTTGALAGPALAQENRNETTVFVVGSGHIRGDDLAAARQEAIDNGLVTAVSRVLTDLMPWETMAGSFQALNDTVLSQTDRFVRDYKVLSESKISNTYRLLVQANISTRRLKDAVQKAGIRLGQLQYPKVLLCIAEKGIDDQVPKYWWGGSSPGEGVVSAAIAKLFSEKGYVIVPSGAVHAANYPPELSASEAAAIGQQLKADIVIAGLASAEEASNTMGASVRSYRGTLNVTAYRVSDGLPIAQVLRTALIAGANAVSGGREALNSVAAMVGEDLAPQISDVWFKQASSTTKIDIVVQGVSGNIANFVKFRGALSSTSGINSLQLKEMMAGAAVLTATYQGSAQALADALLLIEFDTFGIKIDNVEGNSIKMHLAAKPQ